MKILRVFLSLPTIIVFALIIQISGLSQENKYQGLLWEISGNGMKKPSFIYGTMHVSNKVAFHLSDTFFIGIKNCDMVALEINPDTWFEELVKSDLIAGLMQEQNSYSNGWGFYDKAFALSPPENKNIAEVLATDHLLTNYMLYRFGSMSDNFEENTYLDLFIYQTGKKQNKKVSSLEYVNTMLEMTQKASLPDDDDEDYDSNRDWIDKVRASGKSPKELMENAYRLGDLDMLDSLSSMMNVSKNYKKYMIIERNKQMAHRLDSLMKTNSVFAGAGAAHLPGDLGIISILREKGYKVRAVVKSTGKKTDQLMKKSETTFFPLNYKKQFVGDSLFMCGFPGNILETPGFGNNKDYFYPEMINGAHYNISRINTYSPITGFSQEYMMQRLDSMFYESIPGKIIKKTKIIKQGIPGYDILNKTRRGDLQRYQIFVTPIEIIIVKIGGVGDFVKKEGDKFFSSFAFNHQNTHGWKNLVSRKGGFSVSLPVDMLVSGDHLDHSASNEMFQAMDFADSSYFVVMKGSLHDFSYIEEDTFELNYITKLFIKELKFNKIRDSLLSSEIFPTLDASATSDSIRFLHTRLIINGADYYLLANQNFSEKPNAKFFNSFKIQQYSYSEEFVKHVDTNMFFKVTTIKPPNTSSLFGNRQYYGRSKKDDQDRCFMPDAKSNTYYCAQTREQVDVEYYKFHKYFSFDNLDSLWNGQILSFTYNNGLIVKEKSFGLIDSMPYMDLVLTDTNSTRAIKSRIIINHGVAYSIVACVDTISKNSEYINNFFETFRPTDTVIGYDILDDKAKMFFEDIESGDSLRKAQALKSIYVVDFKEKDKEKLFSLIKRPVFYSYSLFERAALLLKLGLIMDDKDLMFLENIYTSADDTSTLQLASLQVLAKHKTLESTKCFTKLLVANPPFTDSKFDMIPLFTPFYDTLELAVNLFPDLLKLTRYDEYNTTVYNILCQLVDSSLISKNVISDNLVEILRDASIELKRQFSSEEGKSGDNDYFDEDIVSETGINIPMPGRKYFNNSRISYFISILAPFYSDNRVSSFYSKIAASKNDDLKFSLTSKCFEKNFPVNDTVYTYFVKSDNYRADFYKLLKENKRLNLVADSLFTQENIARSLLISNNRSGNKDSVVFMGKHFVNTRNKSGYVYFYKTKAKDEKKWNLKYIGFQPADTSTFELEVDVSNYYNRLNELIEEGKQINELIEDIELTGRKRVSSYGGRGLYY